MRCSTEGCFGRPATYVVKLERYPGVLVLCCILCATNAQGKGARIRRIEKGVS